MSKRRCNESGITVVEVVVATFLLSVSILATLALQPTAWKMASMTDNLGRASGIIENEMEALAVKVMNPKIADPVSLSDAETKTVYAGGDTTAKPGDAVFYKNAQITKPGGSLWQIRVTVTWPGNSKGIAGTRLVTRQDDFEK